MDVDVDCFERSVEDRLKDARDFRERSLRMWGRLEG